jgi:hypothetical protein
VKKSKKPIDQMTSEELAERLFPKKALELAKKVAHEKEGKPRKRPSRR